MEGGREGGRGKGGRERVWLKHMGTATDLVSNLPGWLQKMIDWFGVWQSN